MPTRAHPVPPRTDRIVEIAARPEPLTVHLDRTALIVNDLQNAFCSPGGYLELIGFDIGGAAAVVECNRRLIAAMRRAGVPVIYLQNGFSADHREAPGPGTPIWHKSNALRYMRDTPVRRGQLLTHGTWDYAMVDAVAPQPDDIVIAKSRDNGFAGTALDQVLRARDIRTVIITGIASNVGVESTLRAAYHLEYFALMVNDATMQAGPPELQRATEFNVERFFGWVAAAQDVISALDRGRSTSS